MREENQGNMLFCRRTLFCYDSRGSDTETPQCKETVHSTYGDETTECGYHPPRTRPPRPRGSSRGPRYPPWFHPLTPLPTFSVDESNRSWSFRLPVNGSSFLVESGPFTGRRSGQTVSRVFSLLRSPPHLGLYLALSILPPSSRVSTPSRISLRLDQCLKLKTVQRSIGTWSQQNRHITLLSSNSV